MFWDYLTHVQTVRPVEKAWLRWLFSGFGILCGALFLILLAIQAVQLLEETDRNFFWITTTGIRAFAVILLALWIGVWKPWRTTNTVEQRQGRVLNIISIVGMILAAVLVWIDADVYRFPVAGLEYANLFIISS